MSKTKPNRDSKASYAITTGSSSAKPVGPTGPPKAPSGNVTKSRA